MRDLLDAPANEVNAERARVAVEGWGAALLAAQRADGSWAGTAWNRGWDSTMHVLSLLRELGLDPESQAARQAVSRVREHVRWAGWDLDGTWRGEEWPGNPFFAGEVEPCINGQVGAAGAYFGQGIERIIGRLLAEQLPDGGWNCDAEHGSTRSSFNSTICVLEALLACDPGGGPRVKEARLRAEEYLLSRRLFRRLSTGEMIEQDRKGGGSWMQFAFPTWWHYDILRGLDHLREARTAPDSRLGEVLDLLASKRGTNGRWRLDVAYPGSPPVDFGERTGQPSRWITLRAMRVLRWFGFD